jgi:hypothetical protein
MKSFDKYSSRTSDYSYSNSWSLIEFTTQKQVGDKDYYLCFHSAYDSERNTFRSTGSPSVYWVDGNILYLNMDWTFQVSSTTLTMESYRYIEEYVRVKLKIPGSNTNGSSSDTNNGGGDSGNNGGSYNEDTGGDNGGGNNGGNDGGGGNSGGNNGGGNGGGSSGTDENIWTYNGKIWPKAQYVYNSITSLNAANYTYIIQVRIDTEKKTISFINWGYWGNPQFATGTISGNTFTAKGSLFWSNDGAGWGDYTGTFSEESIQGNCEICMSGDCGIYLTGSFSATRDK